MFASSMQVVKMAANIRESLSVVRNPCKKVAGLLTYGVGTSGLMTTRIVRIWKRSRPRLWVIEETGEGLLRVDF